MARVQGNRALLEPTRTCDSPMKIGRTVYKRDRLIDFINAATEIVDVLKTYRIKPGEGCKVRQLVEDMTDL